MSDLKEKTSFEWFNIEESKLSFNFGSLANRLFTEVGIYAEIGIFTNTVYKYNVMLCLSSYVNDIKQMISLNGSNAAMLSTVFDLYSEDSTIREYFNKTLTSNGWYVSNKYTNKAVFQKVLNDKLSIKLVPVTDNRNIPLYKVMFVKAEYTLTMILSRAEMRTISKLLINFASNISMYVFMFQANNKYNKLNLVIDKFDKITGLLEKLTNKECIETKSNYDNEMDWDNNSMVNIDMTDLNEEVNNVDIVDKSVDNSIVSVDNSDKDVLDIDELDGVIKEVIDHSDTNRLIEQKSGIIVGDKDGWNVVDEFTLYPKEEDKVIEPVPGISYIEESELEEGRKVYLNKDVLNCLAKTYKVDRRKKYKGIIKSIEKTGVFNPESIPVMLVNRGMIGIPCTSLLYSISVFAATYEYSNQYPDKDFNELAVSAYKALEMSAVDGHEMFSNNEEFKKIGQKYLEVLIKTVGRDAKDIRTIDKYLLIEKDQYKFCVLDNTALKNLNTEEANCLTAAITDIYLLLYYANTRYLSNRVMQEKNAGLVSLINEQMYTLARNILVELIQYTDKTVYAEHIVRFDETVKFFSWDPEIFKEAYIELFTYALIYKNKIFGKTDNIEMGKCFTQMINVGMPCLTY